MPLPLCILCGRCGYDRKATYAHDPHSPCPECGDTDCPGRLQPWPSLAWIAWRVARVQLVLCGVTFALWAAAAFAGKQGWAAFGQVLLGGCAVAGFVTVVFLVFWPISESVLFSEKYCPEQRRGGVETVLLLAGWGASLLIAVVFVFLAAMLALMLA